MDKRYQVFVSSTYTDLLEERAEVMHALLELDCIPAGMELFPAASEEQWKWIKKVIDESDYYIVILAGRYGSVSGATGISYTEMEYRYALETNKPIIAFLHETPARIPADKTESAPQSRKKLDQFRKLLEQRLCKYWSGPADLGAKVSRSLTQLIKHQPGIGWVRADQVLPSQLRDSHVGSRMFLPVNDGAIYKGKWFGRHLSVAPDDKRTRVFSDHEYTLETDGVQITGQLIDHLVGKRYKLFGGFLKGGILWYLEDENEHLNFGMEIFATPLSGQEMRGFLYAFDYHSRHTFVTPTILTRDAYPDKARFVAGVRALFNRVRVDDDVISTASNLYDSESG